MKFLTYRSFINVITFVGIISCLEAAVTVTQHGSPSETRRRRDTLPVPPLDDIADSHAVPIQRSPISNAVKRSTVRIVDLALFEDSSPPGKQISVYVDDTMTRLIIQVEVDRSYPVIMVTKPSGPGPLAKLNTTTGTTAHIATIDTAITAADYGVWRIMKMDANKWNVKVQGESPLDFTYQFLEGTVFVMPITGDPIQGETYKTVITVPEYAKIQKIDMVFLFITAKSTSVNMMPVTDKGGGRYEISLKVIDQEFMIGIQGKDNSGNFFRRITSLIKPVTLTLYVPSYAGVKLYENATIDIEFSVVNKLKTDQNIDVRIQDTKNFAEAPVFISVTIKPGENFTSKFIIKGGLAGETTVVTITARQYLGFGKGFSLGPSEVRQFTVERSNTTHSLSSTTPSTAKLSTQQSLSVASGSVRVTASPATLSTLQPLPVASISGGVIATRTKSQATFSTLQSLLIAPSSTRVTETTTKSPATLSTLQPLPVTSSSGGVTAATTESPAKLSLKILPIAPSSVRVTAATTNSPATSSTLQTLSIAPSLNEVTAATTKYPARLSLKPSPVAPISIIVSAATTKSPIKGLTLKPPFNMIFNFYLC